MTVPRRARWLILTAVVVVLAAAITIGLLVVTHPQTPPPSKHAALVATLGHVNDVVDTAGGRWTFPDEKTVYDRDDLTGYTTGPCGTTDSGEQYAVTLYGQGQPDVEKAADAVLAKWRAQGYSVSTVYRDGPDLANGTQVRADVPDGSVVVYTVSEKTSIIEVEGECIP
jgi:hypothetical protein